MANTISWTEQYSVYSSTTNLQSGAVIQTSSERTAVGGSSYNLNTSGFFDPGVSGATGSNSYEIINSDPNLLIGSTEMVTAGLVQGAAVNGAVVSAPMSAVGVLYNQTAVFTPIETNHDLYVQLRKQWYRHFKSKWQCTYGGIHNEFLGEHQV